MCPLWVTFWGSWRVSGEVSKSKIWIFPSFCHLSVSKRTTQSRSGVNSYGRKRSWCLAHTELSMNMGLQQILIWDCSSGGCSCLRVTYVPRNEHSRGHLARATHVKKGTFSNTIFIKHISVNSSTRVLWWCSDPLLLRDPRWVLLKRP